MILIIDNYDSFTFNLYQYVGTLNSDVKVYRNDALSVKEIAELNPQRIILSPVPVHGKQSLIKTDTACKLFKGLPQEIEAARYHSLIVEKESLLECLKITAQTADGEIMALKHRDYEIYGVQFHPESVMTPDGMKILANFLSD